MGDHRCGTGGRVARAVLLALVALAPACASGGSDQAFRSTAGQAVEQMVGEVRTAGYAAQLAEGDDAFGTYLAVMTREARTSAESARESGTSVAPPPADAALGAQVDALLGAAVDAVAAAEQAAGLPDPGPLAAQGPRLDDLGRQLEDLQERLR
ncbi:hypothetical protein ACU61A_30150 [Pseudonocardia sichuanensis]